MLVSLRKIVKIVMPFPYVLTLVRYSEIGTKGDNRGFFEELLARNIMAKLNEFGIEAKIEIEQTRLIIDTPVDISSILSTVFGIASFSVAERVNSTTKDIEERISDIRINGTFRVSVNRRYKEFPYTSQDYSSRLGEIILSNNPEARVDLHNYEFNIGVDIGREHTYIYTKSQEGPGGIPVRTQGRGVVLISGGIDSPVAAYMMLKRGMEISLIHYFQSARLLEKVFRNKELLEKYSPYPIEIKIMDHRKLLGPTVLKLREKGEEKWTCIFCKRIMYEEAQKYAEEIGAKAIVTGENLGQVASQTLDNLNTIEEKITIPVFRPLIGFDKIEIERMSEKIGAFDIFLSIPSSCDCYFLPSRPRTRSKIEDLKIIENDMWSEN